jgi:hypothetical protein
MLYLPSVVTLLLASRCLSLPSLNKRQTDSTSYTSYKFENDPALDSFVSSQYSQSLTRLLNNINPAGTATGVIVAAPSKNHPNYWYHWTRDSALVMRSIVKLYNDSLAANDAPLVQKYEQLLWNYVQREQSFRNIKDQTPSRNLGEPKFNVVSLLGLKCFFILLCILLICEILGWYSIY